jgi:hypothetical protein
MRVQATRAFALGWLALFAAACGDSTTGTDGGAGTTTFEGIVAGDSASGLLSGKLSLTIETASLSVAAPAPAFSIAGAEASVKVSGTFTPVGASVITLTGTYDDATKKLSVSGGTLNFNGTFSNGEITGTFTNSSGGGGSFSTSSKSGTSPIYSFCGNAVKTGGSNEGGGATFSLVLNTGSGVASGVALGHSSNDSPVTLSGTVTGSNWSVSFTNTEGQPGTASGTYTSSSLSGTYSIPASPENGTVTASICQ